MHNMLFVSIGMVVLGILLPTCNMQRIDKIKTAVMMIVGLVIVGFTITPDAFWLIPCLFAGTWLGRLMNWSIDKRRHKYLMQVMRENKTSL